MGSSSEEEPPEPKLSRSGRAIRPVFQNDDDASGSEWEAADEYTVRYVKPGKPKSTAKYVKTGKPRGRKPKFLNSAGEKTAKPKYVKTGTGKGRGRPPKAKAAPVEAEPENPDEEEKSSQKTEESAEIEETEEENVEKSKTEILIDDGFSV